jgi:hypothetical protein
MAKNWKTTLSLLVLLIQNTSLALFVKASKEYGGSYIPGTVIFMNEVVKFTISFLLYLRESPQGSFSIRTVGSKIQVFFAALQDKQNLNFLVPTLTYLIQNYIIFYALEMIDAALYQVPPSSLYFDIILFYRF